LRELPATRPASRIRPHRDIGHRTVQVPTHLAPARHRQEHIHALKPTASSISDARVSRAVVAAPVQQCFALLEAVDR
jgi:hypothetical protein